MTQVGWEDSEALQEAQLCSGTLPSFSVAQKSRFLCEKEEEWQQEGIAVLESTILDFFFNGI